MTGASEVFELAADLGQASAKVARVLYDVYAEEGKAFASDWQANARETAGAHAKEYPGYIDSETRVALGIEVEIGPRAEGQGMLGRVLEFGTETSGAHLDGARAMGFAEARLARAADAAIGFVLP